MHSPAVSGAPSMFAKYNRGFVVLLAGEAALACASVLFWLHRPYPPPLSLAADPSVAVALPLFIAGALLTMLGVGWLPLPTLDDGSSRSDRGSNAAAHIGALLLILLLAFVLRGYRLTEMPPPLFDDEANTALDAMRFLESRPASLIGTGWGEVPVAYSALNSLALRAFGPTVLGARATGVVLSTLTVLVFYGVCRWLLSRPAALLAALALAMQRWHVTMSRFGASEIALPFFVCVAFFFTVRGFNLHVGPRGPLARRFPSRLASEAGQDAALPAIGCDVEHSDNSYRWWWSWRPWPVIAGAAGLGVCMYVYLASRLVAFGMVLFLSYLVVHAATVFVRQRCCPTKVAARIVGCVLLYGVTYGIVFAPMAVYYARNPISFTSRWKDISLPAKMNIGKGTIHWQPLWANLTAYPLMLNYAANEVSRYGPPFRPLLNVISGVLFMTGLTCLLRHWWRPAHVFALLWLAMPMLGGMITVSETPSPFRTIVAAPAVALLSVVPVYYAALLCGHGARGAERRRGLYAIATAVILVAGLWDQHTYWVDVRHNPQLHREMNYPEYVVADRVRQLVPTHPVYLDPHYFSFSSLILLNWKEPNMRVFVPSQHIPLLQPQRVDSYVILPSGSESVLAAYRLFYPHAEGKEYALEQAAGFGRYEILIPAGDLAATQGLWAEVASGRELVDGFGVRPLSVTGLADLRWEGVIDVPVAGRYRFSVRSTQPIGDRCRLTIAGRAIPGTDTDVALLAGRVPISLRVMQIRPNERLDVLWKRVGGDWQPVPRDRVHAFPPTGNLGLWAAYYDRNEPSGSPFMERVDYTLGADESLAAPLSVRWVGFLKAPQDGDYEFEMQSDDGSRLVIDGVLLMDLWRLNGGAGRVRHALRAGEHAVQIDYFDAGGGRGFRLRWTPPTGRSEMLPVDVFSHAPPPESDTPFRLAEEP